MVNGSTSNTSPSLTANQVEDDESRRDREEASATRSKMSLKSRDDEERNRAPNELIVATKKVIKYGRSKNKVISELHEELDRYGAVSGYDKEMIGLFMSGQHENVDVGGEEAFANQRVKLKHERAAGGLQAE